MNDITRLAYALHVAQTNGKVDDQVILRCMHLVREGGLDNIRVMEGGKSMEVSKKCPKCGISANKPRFEKYWFCPACCHSFDEEGRIQFMDSNGNYIKEVKQEEAQPAKTKARGWDIATLRKLYPTMDKLDQAIAEAGSMAKLAKKLGMDKQAISNYKYRSKEEPKILDETPVIVNVTTHEVALEPAPVLTPKVSVWELIKELEELDKRKARIVEILNKIEVEAV